MKIKQNPSFKYSNAANLGRDRRIIYHYYWVMTVHTGLIFNRTSEDWSKIKQRSKGGVTLLLEVSPYQLAMQHPKNNKPVTAFEVNEVLSFLGVTITQSLLDEI